MEYARFWWRNERLAEIHPLFPPSAPAPDMSSTDTHPHDTSYTYPYPTTFLPVPHHPQTNIRTLLSHIIPQARAVRSIPVTSRKSGDMYSTTTFDLGSDGMLLYVADATYSPGLTPLVNWIPLNKLEHFEG